MYEKHIGLVNLVVFLNELLEIDREGISTLFAKKAVCNNDLATHPTVQVIRLKNMTDSIKDTYAVGMLGILNGMFGVDSDGWGPIYRQIDEKTRLIDHFGIVSDEKKGK